MGSGNLGEGITLSHDDACGRAEARGYGGQENMGACHDVVGVNNGRIGSDQIVPAKAVSKILLRELPKRVARLHR